MEADIYEQILIRLDVQDLIRCKAVCRSWKSLISESRFVKEHLNHSRNKNSNNEIEHRRIVMSTLHFSLFQFEDRQWYFNLDGDCYLLGSSNGLICILISHDVRATLLVANPLTREVKKIKNPDIACESLCWGFGYDSSIDDYKIIVGFRKTKYWTCFLVLTLKSNFWKVVGEVNYSYFREIGTLCNGALHWLMEGQTNGNKVIISFNISQEEFKEIPQPGDAAYASYASGYYHTNICLGVMEGCLCIFHQDSLPDTIWKMSKYNVKESWGMIRHNGEIKNDVVHCLRELKHGNPYDNLWCHDIWLCRTFEIIGAHIFVQSLVSPHVHNYERKKRERRAANVKRSSKLIMGGLS